MMNEIHAGEYVAVGVLIGVGLVTVLVVLLEWFS